MAARAARLARTAARAAATEIPPAAVEAHAAAVARGLQTYDDPTTGYTVFTELAHRARAAAAVGCAGTAATAGATSRLLHREADKSVARSTRARATAAARDWSGPETRKPPNSPRCMRPSAASDELGVKLGIAAFHTTVEEGGVDVRSRLLKTQALLLDAGTSLC